MISSTPRHCWKSGRVAAHKKVTRPPVCWARRVAKRRATADSLVFSITTRNFRGVRPGAVAELLMGRMLTLLPPTPQKPVRPRAASEILRDWPKNPEYQSPYG